VEESGFPKTPPRYHLLTRGVKNNIKDTLVNFRGSAVESTKNQGFGRDACVGKEWAVISTALF